MHLIEGRYRVRGRVRFIDHDVHQSALALHGKGVLASLLRKSRLVPKLGGKGETLHHIGAVFESQLSKAERPYEAGSGSATDPPGRTDGRRHVTKVGFILTSPLRQMRPPAQRADETAKPAKSQIAHLPP